jgi:small subunit ribosomal protein S21
LQEIKSVTKHITVNVFRGDTEQGLEKALRIFKKKIQASGLFKTMKEKRYFEKPGDKMRRKRRENQRRLRKTEKGKNRR